MEQYRSMPVQIAGGEKWEAWIADAGGTFSAEGQNRYFERRDQCESWCGWLAARAACPVDPAPEITELEPHAWPMFTHEPDQRLAA